MASNEIKLGINLRKNKNSKNAGFGKYYPEVDMQSTLSLKGFAAHLAKHGCIYGLDIIEGVLKKITQCLPELISQGVPVELAPLGRFVPTCSVDKPVLNIPAMEGADPNDVVKGVHIRFYPYGVEDDNITSRRFKQEYCSLEFRNIVDTQEVTLNGKTKKVQTLKPIETALAEWKQEHGSGSTGNGGSGTGDNSGGGSSNQTLASPTISGNTTDGTVPTAESTLYSEAFTLSATTTVKAIAIKDGQSSEVASRVFTKSSNDDGMGQD